MYQPSESDAPVLSMLRRVPLPAMLTRPDSSPLATSLKVGWFLAVVLLLAYTVLLATLTSQPFQDYPNHIARAAVLSDLIFHHGQHFGGLFEFHPVLAPYLLHDALLTLCITLLGVNAGAGLFTVLVFLSLPCALLLYVRVNHLERSALALFLLGMYLTTDSFFFMAFMGFRLAVASIVVSISLTDVLRRRWSAPLFITYTLVLVAGYLIHLTSVVFFAPALAVSGAMRLWSRQTSVRVELALWAPAAALLVLHFGLVAGTHNSANPPAYVYWWGTVREKLRELDWDFFRFGGRPTRTLICLFGAALFWAIRRDLTLRSLRQPIVIEQLLIAAAFLGVYWVLPGQYADSSFVDVRALPMIALFVVFACLQLSGRPESKGAFESPTVLLLAVLLAGVNLSYLVLRIGSNETWLSQYRRLAANIPPGSHVLPVNTLGTQHSIAPFLHAGSYLVLDRGAQIPYLFSADRGDPMKYFRYSHRPYMPDESWYLNHREWNKGYPQSYEVDGHWYTWRFHYSKEDRDWQAEDLAPVDWTRIACTYDYLMITRPFEAGYIRVPVRQVAYNEAAALYAVDRSACHPEPMRTAVVRLPLEH